MKSKRITSIALALLTSLAVVMQSGGAAAAQQPPAMAAAEGPYTVEYYYKVKWGYADEWLRLFKKNHLPILMEGVKAGALLRVSADAPRLHATEDGRWDYRVTIVYRNALIASLPGGSNETARRLFPDQETFQKEEQRRFEILLGHWDVPIVEVKMP